MINKGWAYKHNKPSNYGQSFIAAFDINTGNPTFIDTNIAKGRMIVDYKIKKDTLLIFFKDGMTKYLMKKGLKISEKRLDINKEPEIESFIGKDVFVRKDKFLTNLISTDTTNFYVITKSGQYLVLNNNFEKINQIDSNIVYLKRYEKNGIKLLVNGLESILVDKKNNVYTDIKLSNTAKLVGSKIYDTQENKLIEMDLKNLE